MSSDTRNFARYGVTFNKQAAAEEFDSDVELDEVARDELHDKLASNLVNLGRDLVVSATMRTVEQRDAGEVSDEGYEDDRTVLADALATERSPSVGFGDEPIASSERFVSNFGGNENIALRHAVSDIVDDMVESNKILVLTMSVDGDEAYAGLYNIE